MKKAIKFKRSLVSRALSAALESWKDLRSARAMAFAALALTTVVILFTAALVIPRTIRADNDDEVTTFTIDVAQIASTNAQNNINPSEPPELFVRGDTFILGGTIYNKGKLQRGAADNDPTEPGIGKYHMRGTYTDSPTTTLPIVAFSTELFELPNEGGSLLIDGLWPSEGFSAHRVVLGGTGRFRYAVGEVYEENLGLNKDKFCNLRVTFRLRKASGRHDH